MEVTNFSDNVKAYFNNERYSDFTFIVGSKRYPAHKIVLSQLKYFREYFRSSVNDEMILNNELLFSIGINTLYGFNELLFSIGIHTIYIHKFTDRNLYTKLLKLEASSFVEFYKTLQLWNHPILSKIIMFGEKRLSLFEHYHYFYRYDDKNNLIKNHWEFVLSISDRYIDGVASFFERYRVKHDKSFIKHPIFYHLKSDYQAMLLMSWGKYKTILKIIDIDNCHKLVACNYIRDQNIVLKHCSKQFINYYIERRISAFSPKQKRIMTGKYEVASLSPFALSHDIKIGNVVGYCKENHAVVVKINTNIRMGKNTKVFFNRLKTKKYKIIIYGEYEKNSLYKLYPGLEYTIGLEYIIEYDYDDPYPPYPFLGSDVYIVRKIY